MMFDHLIEENNLRPEFEKYGLRENDIVFVKEQIAGPLQSEMCSQQIFVSGERRREGWGGGGGGEGMGADCWTTRVRDVKSANLCEWGGEKVWEQIAGPLESEMCSQQIFVRGEGRRE